MLNIDPQDTEEFFIIKGEVDKLSGTDYSLVISLCEKLLTMVGKDIRIAGYLTFAKLQLSGIDGFCEGLNVYIQLLTDTKSQLFPQRENAKLSSIQWLNQPKVKDALKNKLSEKQDELTRLVESIEKLNQQLKVIYPESPEILTSMTSFIKNKLQAITKPVELIPIQEVTASNDSLPKIQMVEKIMVCNSYEDLENFTMLQIKYCLEQKRFDQAVYYAKALHLNTDSIDELLKPLLSCEAENILGVSDKEIKRGIEKIIFFKKNDLKKDGKAILPIDSVNQYRGVVAGKSFEEKMMVLNSDFKSHEDFLIRLAMVRFCIEDRQLDLAWRLLKKLNQWINDCHLYHWQPEIALFTWEEMCLVLTLIYDDFLEDEKNDARKIWSDSFQKMCEINLVRAMKVKRNFK